MMATLGTMCPAITVITILVFKVKAVIMSIYKMQLTLNGSAFSSKLSPELNLGRGLSFTATLIRFSRKGGNVTKTIITKKTIKRALLYWLFSASFHFMFPTRDSNTHSLEK